MSQIPSEADAAHVTVALDMDELRALREAEEQARALRQEAIAREQARLGAVVAVLDVTPVELLGLPARKHRRRRAGEAE